MNSHPWHIHRWPHDDVIKWKHFPVNSPHKGQRRGALMFYLICARINGWVNNGDAGDLRRHRAYYDVIVMFLYQNVLSVRRWGSFLFCFDGEFDQYKCQYYIHIWHHGWNMTEDLWSVSKCWLTIVTLYFLYHIYCCCSFDILHTHIIIST